MFAGAASRATWTVTPCVARIGGQLSSGLRSSRVQGPAATNTLAADNRVPSAMRTAPSHISTTGWPTRTSAPARLARAAMARVAASGGIG
jgi:hypothetical protein